MSANQALYSSSGLFGRLGYPSEQPQNTVPLSPEMARSIEAMNAHIEARRLQMEAEMNTPEGRKKAAEMKLADIERKKSNWFSRAFHDRGNGWKPIWGTAEDEEMRIYTLLDSDEHRFWGVKPIGMTIYDFWEKYDPEVKRYEDRQQETPVNPDAPAGPLIGEPPRSPIPKRAAAKPVDRPKTPELKSNQRVRKSKTQPRKSNRNTRKSLARMLDAGHPELERQSREVPTKPHVGGKLIRTKLVDKASSSQQKEAKKDEGSVNFQHPRGAPNTKTKAIGKDDTVPSKRPRGRPPMKRKSTERPPKQRKTPATKENAGVQKVQRAERLRPLAPSTHKMRTRGKGPAEPLRLP